MEANIKLAFSVDSYTETDDFYHLYLLQKRASHYGDGLKSSADKAYKELVAQADKKWLAGKFNEKNWQVDGNAYGVESTQVAEMLSHLMSQGKLEQQISHKLDKAFKSLIENTLYESPTQAFFISKDRSVNTLQANAHLLTSLVEFSRGQLSSYPISKMRNYFLVKAELSENLVDVLYSIIGLKLATNHAPFLTVDSLSNTHGSAQVTDYLGNHIKFRHDLTKFDFTTGAKTVSMLTHAKLNQDNGLINFVFFDGSQTHLNPGNYHIDLETKAGIRTSTRSPFTISAVEVVEFTRVRYEISRDVLHEGDYNGVASYPEPLKI